MISSPIRQSPMVKMGPKGLNATIDSELKNVTNFFRLTVFVVVKKNFVLIILCVYVCVCVCLCLCLCQWTLLFCMKDFATCYISIFCLNSLCCLY
jgi:hypothetical protein